MTFPIPSQYGPVHDDASWGHERLELPESSNPQQFQKYAIDDLASGDSERNNVNSLSNAKRALHYQIELIGSAFGMDANQHRNFPTRIEFCQRCGIVGPRVLAKLNHARNALEHDYSVPTRSETEDFVDIVELFLAATDRFIYQFPNDLEFIAEPLDESTPNVHLVKLKPFSGLILLKCRESDDLEIPVSDDAYFEWTKALINVPVYG